MLIVKPVDEESEESARQLILSGLKERFGFLIEGLNPDLDNIHETYIKRGAIFLTGFVDDELVLTGGLIPEGENTGRIVRVSVHPDYRNRGYARQMVHLLEELAKERGFKKIAIETNQAWTSAVNLYLQEGYMKVAEIDHLIHFEKELA